MRLKTFLSIISTTVLLVFVSCTKDPTEPQRAFPQGIPEEDGYVTVGVGLSVEDEGIPTKSVITIADNDTPDIVTINDVRLGIYNADGSLFKDEYFPSGQDLKISLRKGDSYTIYTLVNMGPAISFPQNEDAIVDIYYSVSSLSDINTVGFPLHGPLEGTSVTAGIDPKIRVTVRNLLSKITLSINRSALAAHNGSFTVTGLRLVNSPKGAYPFREESKASSSTDVFTGDQATADDMAALNGGSEAVFYVFENMQGDLLSTSNRNSWNKIAPDAKKNVCTYIELIGEYTTDGGALKAENTYRMYLGENEYYNFDIKRNTKRWISVVLGDLGFRKESWKVLSDVTSDDRSIVFDPMSMTLEEGDSRQYTVLTNPSGLSYICTLSDALECLLSFNEQTGTLSLPTAPESDVYGTLTATTWDGRKSATMNITAKANRKLESLTVSPTSKTVFVDGSFTITATAYFSDGTEGPVSCGWSSNHSNIASVTKDGLVTGLSSGSAVITASYEGKTASCSVTVKEVGVTQEYGTPVITVTYPDIPADGSGVYPTIHVSQSVTLKYEDSRPDVTGDPVEVDLTYPFQTTGDIFVKSFEMSNGRSGTGSALSTSGNERGKASASSRGTTEGARRAVEDVTVVVTGYDGKDSEAKKVTVYQEANTKTQSSDATDETEYIEIILTPSAVSSDGEQVTVSGLLHYTHTDAVYSYTSGATSGGGTSEETTPVTLTNVTVTPASGTPAGKASVSGSTITVQSNDGESQRKWTVNAKYNGTPAESATLTQAGQTAEDTYGDIIITIDPVDDIPASGGTSSAPTVTYSQMVYPAHGEPYKVTSGGTVYYGSTNNPTSTSSSNATVSAKPLDTTVKGRTKVGTRYVKVALYGEPAVVSFDIYQQANELLSTHYKAVDGAVGENEQTSNVSVKTYGTPTISIGSGLYAGTSSATVSASVTNSCTGTVTRSWYQKYTSGSWSTLQSSSSTAEFQQAGEVLLDITSNGGNRFSLTGTTLKHSTMGTTTGTESVTVRARNAGSTGKSADASKSVTNSVTGTTDGHYGGPYDLDIDLSPTTVSYGGGYSTVTGSFWQTYYKPETVYSSGATSGGGSEWDCISSNVSLSSLSVSPSGTASASGKTRVNVTENTSTSSRSWTVTGTYYYSGTTYDADATLNQEGKPAGPVVTTGHELKLTGSDIEVTVGSTATASRSARYYTITYHDGVEYDRTYTTVTATLSSSNTTVASVSGTTVTGNKVGTAYLTGTYNGYTSTNSIEVDVVADEPVVTTGHELELTGSDIEVTVGSTATASRSAKYYTITYHDGVEYDRTYTTVTATLSSSSTTVASVSGTTVTGKKVGTAYLTGTYNGYTSINSIEVTVKAKQEDSWDIDVE